MTVYTAGDVTLKHSKEWHMTEIHSKWSVADGTAVGCANFSGWQANPQYKITVKKPSRVVITLDHKVQTEDDEYIGFYLAKAPESGRLTSLKQRVAVTAFTPTQSKYSQYGHSKTMLVTCDVNLEVGEYIVLPSTFQAGVEAEFVLAFFAEVPSISVVRI